MPETSAIALYATETRVMINVLWAAVLILLPGLIGFAIAYVLKHIEHRDFKRLASGREDYFDKRLKAREREIEAGAKTLVKEKDLRNAADAARKEIADAMGLLVQQIRDVKDELVVKETERIGFAKETQRNRRLRDLSMQRLTAQNSQVTALRELVDMLERARNLDRKQMAREDDFTESRRSVDIDLP